MNFKKSNYSGQYQATRTDGQVIKIEKEGKKWNVTYQDDFYNDNFAEFASLKDAKSFENQIERAL